MPSARTMTPEPTEPVGWLNWPQKGSRTVWTPWAAMLTTAGAVSCTTGAKLAFTAPASRGTTRSSAWPNVASCALP